jgi:hypothetical protein
MPNTDIATLLSEAARSGRLTALTIWPAGKGWQVNAQNRSGGWDCRATDDIVGGVVGVLTGPFIAPPKSAPAAKPDKGGVFD